MCLSVSGGGRMLWSLHTLLVLLSEVVFLGVEMVLVGVKVVLVGVVLIFSGIVTVAEVGCISEVRWVSEVAVGCEISDNVGMKELVVRRVDGGVFEFLGRKSCVIVMWNDVNHLVRSNGLVSGRISSDGRSGMNVRGKRQPIIWRQLNLVQAFIRGVGISLGVSLTER